MMALVACIATAGQWRSLSDLPTMASYHWLFAVHEAVVTRGCCTDRGLLWLLIIQWLHFVRLFASFRSWQGAPVANKLSLSNGRCRTVAVADRSMAPFMLSTSFGCSQASDRGEEGLLLPTNCHYRCCTVAVADRSMASILLSISAILILASMLLLL
jgi:hypothetical protein